jgi:hypothetical protein
MEFNYGNEPMGYMKYGSKAPVNDTSDLGESKKSDIEGPVLYPGDFAQSVTEGSRFGTFMQTVTGAIRTGASKVELQFGGGNEPNAGAESYGREAKEALREMAKANEVELTSVHVPTHIGNLSGFHPQQGFVEEQRQLALEEIKKAINFASDVTRGGSITFHTGEYSRPISEQTWAKRKDASGNEIKDSKGNSTYDFLGYQEEPGRASKLLVDNRTGRLIQEIRKTTVIREPDFLRATKEQEGMGLDVSDKPAQIKEGDLITLDGKKIDPDNVDHLFYRVAAWDKDYKRFKTHKLSWDEIEERTKQYNSRHPENRMEPEEMAYRIQVENQIMQYRGSSLYHGRQYENEEKERKALVEALKYYEDLEKSIPKDELWKIAREDHRIKYGLAGSLGGTDSKLPSAILKEALFQIEKSMQYIHEASASADAQADLLKDTLGHIDPVSEFAKKQTFNSMAEAGIYAWKTTNEKKLSKDIYLSPENVFPEMGYGSHPDEMIEMIKGSRQKMIEFLTSPTIEDPHQRIKLLNEDKKKMTEAEVRSKYGHERLSDEDIKKLTEGETLEKIRYIDNPYRVKGISEAEAAKLAEKHIKANLDTQHLGMWGKYFQPKYIEEKGRMENPDETKKRFEQWYNEQIKKLAKENILGEVHIVDGFASGGHTHLPAGQGELPVVDAVKYLKEKGFKGVLVSEGHGEESWGPGRILKKTWEAFGSPVFSSGYFAGGGGFGAPIRFTDINNSYFKSQQGAYFVFGGYAPSNDWTLWSEVPLE